MLDMTQLIGFGAGSSGPATVEYINRYVDGSAATVYTFASSSLGTEGGNRHILVAVASASGTAGRTINGVTVSGVAATQIHSGSAGTTRIASLWSARVPAGATGDVVVTFSGAMAHAGVVLYAARNLSNNSAVATASDDTDGTLDLTLTGSTNGFFVGVAYGSQTLGCTWGGLTENADATVGTGRITAASLNSVLGGAVAITVTFGYININGIAVYMV